ncbi:MAG: flagellar hook-length control protein FliK [Betaproteobacteria bacterium]|nr:flagellar hook-length control protein FliK [Betaproteobacteria bacterium]
MLPPEILSALKAYVQSREPLPTGATDTPSSQANSSFNLGQTVQGTVLAETSTGVFTVRVAQQLVQLNLPETIRTGDVVQLQVLSLQPRLTFGLSTSENPTSTLQQLSDAARLLSNLTTDTPSKALIQGSSQAPLMASPGEAPVAAQLVTQLQQAIQDSGLFYESHQAQWVAGTRTTAQLMAEPQNQPPSAAQTAATARPAVLLLADAAPPQAAAQSPAVAQTAASSAAAAQAGSSALAAGQNLPVPPHLQALVQQQLQALETGHLLWQGQFFPGQYMQWELWREPGQGGGKGSGQQEAPWTTSIRMDLPNLGPVNARLQWAAGGVHVALTAASEQTRTLMNNSRPQLLSALAAAGVPVSGTTVGLADEST